MTGRIPFFTISLLAAGAVVCWGAVEPNYREGLVIDRLVAGGRANAGLRPLALETLARIARGLPDSVSPEAAAAFGVPAGNDAFFGAEDVRMHAVLAIGGSGFPEAEAVLASIQLEPNPPAYLPRALLGARQRAHYEQLPDAREKESYLAELIRQGDPGNFAVGEACDSGNSRLLPLFESATVTSGGITQPMVPPEVMRVCREKIYVLSTNSDRAKALGSVLKVSDQPGDYELMVWAVMELEKMNTPEADAEMKRFAAEVDKLPDPDNDPSHSAALTIRSAMRRLTARREAVNAPLPGQDHSK